MLHWWGKTIFASHGGECTKIAVSVNGRVEYDVPEDYQSMHEEADTLVAFHTAKIDRRCGCVGQ